MKTQTLLKSRAARLALAAALYVTGIMLLRFLGLDDPGGGFSAEALETGNTGLLLVWAVGHCDGMDGPVVTRAKQALEAGNVNLVLPWVRAEDENEIKKAFEQALAVRGTNPAVKDLADMHFFETLVRIHRAGEGEPYTGLKPAGRDLGPAIPAADRALEDGSVDKLVALVTDAVARSIRQRFHAAWSKKHFDRNDVEAGREYVEAYVSYVHLVEQLYEIAHASGHAHHHEAEHAVAHAH